MSTGDRAALEGIAHRAAALEDANDIDDAARVRMYGRRALAAQSASDRADVFGDLIMTCAHCHATLRDR